LHSCSTDFFVNLSLAYSQQQGIGIIFIEEFFATCFVMRGGPMTIKDHFDRKRA